MLDSIFLDRLIKQWRLRVLLGCGYAPTCANFLVVKLEQRNFHGTSNCIVCLLRLLAPTGALVVMMVYYTYIYQPTFSDFHSVP